MAPDFPFPPNHGGRADIWSRIKCLHAIGLNIDLVVTASPLQQVDYLDEVNRYVSRIHFFERKADLLYLLKFLPYQVASRDNLSLYESSVVYDLVWLESECVAGVLRSKQLRYRTLALRVHNDEVLYFKALAKSTSNLFVKLHYYAEAGLYFFFSRKIKAKVNFEMHISKDELRRSQSQAALDKKLIFLPSHFEIAGLKKPVLRTEPLALFIGNLFTSNNLAGLFWYLENVHPIVLLAVPSYRLIVAGNTKGSDVGCKIKHFEAVDFYDSPESLSELYDDCSVFVNPMLEGAGVKIKTLNAIAEGLPLVSTSIGVEGIGLVDQVHFSLADNHVGFARAVITLLESSGLSLRMANAAQDYLLSNYDAFSTLANLMDDINSGY